MKTKKPNQRMVRLFFTYALFLGIRVMTGAASWSDLKFIHPVKSHDQRGLSFHNHQMETAAKLLPNKEFSWHSSLNRNTFQVGGYLESHLRISDLNLARMRSRSIFREN